MSQPNQLINGQWHLGEGSLLTSVNPARNQVIWQGNTASVAQVSSAVLTARQAFTSWSQTPIEQRIAIIGDGDFVSNTYIGNAANLDFSIALINWLVQDDELITLPVKTTLDSQLDLSRNESLIIGLGFLLVLPSILLSIGFGLWWYRRRQ